MGQAQKVFLSFNASKAEGSDDTELELKREMECSIIFLASVIKAAMKDDDILASAIALATIDHEVNINIEEFKNKIKNLTVQNYN
jgi:hypothetical protein